jgi:hypothetical protein
VDIAGQKPATVALLAIYRHAMPGELCRLPASAWGHLQCVPASRVGDLADNNDLFQLAGATDPHLLVGGPEVGRKSLPAERRLAGGEKNDILRVQGRKSLLMRAILGCCRKREIDAEIDTQ